MQNFDYQNPTRILFGKGRENEVGATVKEYGYRCVLLHYGGGSVKRSGLLARVNKSLQNSGIKVIELGGVVPNPELDLVYTGIELCKSNDIDLILAVGGGSTIDSAKAIASGVFYAGDVWDLYQKGGAPERFLPVACILTIPAAGSESSESSVITNAKTNRKLAYGNTGLFPKFSIVDPELFFTLPKEQIAYGVSDMMSHIMERYFTNTPHNEMTDGLCESLLRTIMQNAPLVLKNPQDYDAFAEIAFSGTFAHNGLLGMGREEDWASHNIEHELSAKYGIAHGAGLAVVTPAWMKAVWQKNSARFVQFAKNVMGVEAGPQEEVILEGILRLENFYRSMGLAVRLKEMQIENTAFAEMAAAATRTSEGKERPLGGLKKLYVADIVDIFERAYQ